MASPRKRGNELYEALPGDVTVLLGRGDLVKVNFKIDGSGRHVVVDHARPWPLKGVSRVGDVLVAVNGVPTTSPAKFARVLEFLNRLRPLSVYQLTFRLPNVHDRVVEPHSYRVKLLPSARGYKIEGELRKLSQGKLVSRPTWHAGRYFVLDPDRGTLRRYQSFSAYTLAAGGGRVGYDELPLSDVMSVSEALSLTEGPVRFNIFLRNGQQRVLEAGSPEDARVWVYGIAAAAGLHVCVDGFTGPLDAVSFDSPEPPQLTGSLPPTLPAPSAQVVAAVVPAALPAAPAAQAPAPLATQVAAAPARPRSPEQRARDVVSPPLRVASPLHAPRVTSPLARQSPALAVITPASPTVSPVVRPRTASRVRRSPSPVAPSPQQVKPPSPARQALPAALAPASPELKLGMPVFRTAPPPPLQSSPQLRSGGESTWKSSPRRPDAADFDILYEQCRILVLPPPKHVGPGPAKQPLRLGLSLSCLPDGGVFVAAAMPPPAPATPSANRVSARVYRAAVLGQPQRAPQDAVVSHQAAAVDTEALLSCTTYHELKELTRHSRASNGSSSELDASRTSAVSARSQASEDAPESSLLARMLVFDENNLPEVTPEGVDVVSGRPVCAVADGTGLKPGDVILSVSSVEVKPEEGVASVAKRLLRLTMSGGAWVIAARPIGVMRKSEASAAASARSKTLAPRSAPHAKQAAPKQAHVALKQTALKQPATMIERAMPVTQPRSRAPAPAVATTRPPPPPPPPVPAVQRSLPLAPAASPPAASIDAPLSKVIRGGNTGQRTSAVSPEPGSRVSVVAGMSTPPPPPPAVRLPESSKVLTGTPPGSPMSRSAAAVPTILAVTLPPAAVAQLLPPVPAPQPFAPARPPSFVLEDLLRNLPSYRASSTIAAQPAAVASPQQSVSVVPAAAPASRGYVPGKSILSDLLDDSDDSETGNLQAHAVAQPDAIASYDSDESRSQDPLPDALPAALPAALAPQQDGPLALFGLDLELSEGEIDAHDDADTEPGSDYFDSDESRD